MTAALKLYQMPPVLNMQPSGFGLKLETWLRLSGVDYDVEFTAQKMGPKGKIPYVELDGSKLGDTEIIIEALIRRGARNLDAGLSDEEKAHSLLLRRLAEEHLYFGLVYARWIDPVGWQPFKERLFGAVPLLMRGMISKKIRKMVEELLHGQGIGRHSAEEVYAKTRDDLQAISKMLGDKPYFLGERPTLADASLYGLLANIYFQEDEIEIKRALKTLPNLCRYVERMKAEIWPEAQLGGGEETSFRVSQVPDVRPLKSA